MLKIEEIEKMSAEQIKRLKDELEKEPEKTEKQGGGFTNFAAPRNKK